MAAAVIGATGSRDEERSGADRTRILDHRARTDGTIALDERIILEEFKQAGRVSVHHTFTTSVMATGTP